MTSVGICKLASKMAEGWMLREREEDRGIGSGLLSAKARRWDLLVSFSNLTVSGTAARFELSNSNLFAFLRDGKLFEFELFLVLRF